MLPGVLFVGFSLFSGVRAAPPTQPSPTPSRSEGWLGVSSCTSSACHNQQTTHPPKGSEYSIWLENDRHAQAHAALHSERSKRIWKNYQGLATVEEAHPENETLCLSCHVRPDPELKGWGDADPGIQADGVSCETCHGPAQNWITRHHLPTWKGMSTQSKAELGFVDTKNWVVRAKLCSECHVGLQGMDVNHDLIAAGHPRLRFDFSAYLDHYPGRHWSAAADKARAEDWETRIWATGQLVSSRSALELLAVRAESPSANRPWPELAEYQCSACHQDLKEFRGNRIARPFENRAVFPAWGTWSHATVGPLLKGLEDPDLSTWETQWQELNRLMVNKSSKPSEIVNKARNLGQLLERAVGRLETRETLAPTFRPLWDSLRIPPTPRPNWDEMTQRYLGLVAIHQNLRDRNPSISNSEPAIRRETSLTNLMKQLEDSFGSGRERLSETPDRFDPKSSLQALERIPDLPVHGSR